MLTAKARVGAIQNDLFSGRAILGRLGMEFLGSGFIANHIPARGVFIIDASVYMANSLGDLITLELHDVHSGLLEDRKTQPSNCTAIRKNTSQFQFAS